MWIFCLSTWICTTYVPGEASSQNMVPETLNLELWIVVSPHISIGNWTHLLHKIRKCCSLLGYLSCPVFFFSLFLFFFMIFIYNACIFSYPSLMVLNMHFLLVRSYSSYKLNYDISGFWKWVQKWNECISLYRNFSEILFFVCWFKFLWRVEEGPNMYLWLSCMSLLRTDRPLTNEIHLPLPPEW